MFWGRFRTRSDSIRYARGRFRTRSDSIGRASQRPWTRLDEWPDPVRSKPASDTFPDPSPESDSSRFVRSLNLPNIQCKINQSDLNPNAPTFNPTWPSKIITPSVLEKHPENETHITNFNKETNQKTQKPNDSLNLIFFNARSILNKLSELTEQINSGHSSQAPTHVVAVTETLLYASVPDSCLTIPSFSQVLHTDRSSLSVSPDGHNNRRGGGVLLLPRERQVPTQRRSTMLARKCLDWPSFWVVSTVHPQWRRVTSKTSLPCWNSH